MTTWWHKFTDLLREHCLQWKIQYVQYNHLLSSASQMTHVCHLPSGEQYTYKCLSCPFSTMTISQLKEHSLRDHGEALTLPKLRAATQAAHAALKPSRLATNAEQASLAQDGMRSSVMSL